MNLAKKVTDQNKIPIKVSAHKVPGAKELGADKVARNTALFDQDAPVLRQTAVDTCTTAFRQCSGESQSTFT